MGTTTSAFLTPAPAILSLPAAMPCRRPGPLPRRGLRVMRLAEEVRQPGQAGCMRISGRLADVCAELERLAGLESGFPLQAQSN